MTKDMTSGSTFRQIFLFSIPFLIGNLFQQFYNIADMVVVGRTLGTEAYAAVGATGSLVWFASGAVQMLASGFAVLTANYFGAKNEEKIKQSFAVAIKLSTVLSIALAVVCVRFARPILVLLRTPADLIEQSYLYIVWIFVGLIATALYNLLSHMVRALGDAKTPLYFLIIACVLNIILDILFIAGFGMDTDGAGLATVLAQLFSGLLCIIYIKKKHPLLHLSRRHFKIDLAMDIKLLKLGIPMAFLNMVLSAGAIVMQFVTNGMGTLYVSSTTTGSKIETFVTQPILSFGSAVAVFAAQNFGAGKLDRVLEGRKKGVLMCLGWWLIASAIMLPFGRFFVRTLAGDVADEVVRNAYIYIVGNTLMLPMLSFHVICKSALQAVGRTTLTMISGFTEIIGRTGMAITVLLLLKSEVIGNTAGFVMMCFASPLAWTLGYLTVIPDYFLMKRSFRKAMQKTE